MMSFAVGAAAAQREIALFAALKAAAATCLDGLARTINKDEGKKMCEKEMQNWTRCMVVGPDLLIERNDDASF